MEAEVNTFTISEETTREIFFQEEARRIREAFDSTGNSTCLSHLRSQLKNMRRLLANLQLPWSACIPILFRSVTTYMKAPDTTINNQKGYKATAQLVDSIAYFSQSGREIQALITFFDNQIADIDRMLAAKQLPGE